ncbi:phage protein Gp36 family protein [Citrobacter koseri]|nr:phage protein Gp36 family protein [Citrobacter koseri]MDT7483698.1 phage protein Gp36 family protein [Citrobacter koseri]
MTQINHDVVRSAIRELIDSKTISGAALARETGTSTATVSQFLNGKYKGDNDTVAASLNTWLESHNAAKTTLPVAPDFVETPTSQKILATLTWAQLAGTIVLVYGNSGVGKTKAIRQYAAGGNNVWHITASKSRSNELETLYELALKMGISDAPYRRGALSRLLRQRLPDTRGLIVVDEADWLSLDAVEELRILQRHQHCRCRPSEGRENADCDRAEARGGHWSGGQLMGIYVTRDDLLATDAERVWNMALNKATQQLDEEKIQRAIDDTDAEINSFLAKRYHLPLNLPTLPSPLRRAAVSIAFYWLSERDSQITDEIQKRYDDALRTLREIANGTRDLGVPSDTPVPETDTGKLIIVSDNRRLFTRNNLKGVL